MNARSENILPIERAAQADAGLQRCAIAETALATTALQLLPGVRRKLELLERACAWQNSFARTELKDETIALIAFCAGAERKNIKLLLHSISCQSLPPTEIVLFGASHTLLQECTLDFPILAGRLSAVQVEEEVDIDLLRETVSGMESRRVLLLDKELILNPQALFIAVKNAIALDSPVLFSNHLVMRSSFKVASKYMRRSEPGPYDLLSFDHTGGCLCFGREFLSTVLADNLLDAASSNVFFWTLAASAQMAGADPRLIPLSLSFQSLGSFNKNLPDYESVRNLSTLIAQRLELPLEELHEESIGLLSARAVTPVFAPVEGRLNVVIPFRDCADDTIKCLKSLSKQQGLGEVSVSLVNNNSTPEELERVRQFVNESVSSAFRVRFVNDTDYFNFARLINVGTRAADADFYLWLNNDVELLDSKTIARMLGWMRLPDVGIVGGKLFYPDSSVQHGGIVFSALGPKNVDSVGEYQDLCREVDGVSFAMALVRRELFEEVGGLDEFLCPNGFGDALFCETARETGWRTIYSPRATAYHYESKSRKEQVEDQERFELSLAGIDIAERYREFHSERRAEEFDILASEPIDRLAAILLNNRTARKYLNFFAAPVMELGRWAKNSFFQR